MFLIGRVSAIRTSYEPVMKLRRIMSQAIMVSSKKSYLSAELSLFPGLATNLVM